MHKAKTFCYVSLGILSLALAFHLGARSARASYVPPGETGVVSAVGGSALLENGEVWYQDHAAGAWSRQAMYDPPVPVIDIKFWSPEVFVTRTNEGWVLQGGTWTSLGPPPGLMATESSTWGRVKAKFGEAGE